MSEIPMIWKSGARKEAGELLTRLWSTGSDEAREKIAQTIIAGPPAELLDRIEPEERNSSRDRRIFDRLAIIERVGAPPLNQALTREAERLRVAYPHWLAQDGERALFTTWSEVRIGNETNYSSDALKEMEALELAEVLSHEEEFREGLMDAWREVGVAKPDLAIAVMELLTNTAAAQPPEIYQYGLWGVRDSAALPEYRTRTLSIALALPAETFARPEIVYAVADVLDAASKGKLQDYESTIFWELFDATLLAAAMDPDNAEVPEDRGWISLSINRSMGRLATAFLARLFARGLKVGDGIPKDLVSRFDLLLSPGTDAHRPARVIAASRLSYLYAVDSSWANAVLVPRFDWADEVEALAVWQGFAWQPRIDEKLWPALKPHFLGLFEAERMEHMRSTGRNMAAMLMLIGVEFGASELPRDDVRQAIKAMPGTMRTEAAAWIASYLQQPNEEPIEGRNPRADELWTKKVAPWLKLVWPVEPEFNERGTSSQFARAAVATNHRFPEAVAMLTPYLRVADADLAIHELASSGHPEVHPEASLSLLTAIVNLDTLYFADDVGTVLQRIGEADPALMNSNAFRRLDEQLRVQRH